jgi:micrococcal nuclease
VIRLAAVLCSLALSGNPLAGIAAAQARQEPGCVVGRIVDGDTFSCRDGRRVRLIGIDAPERRQSFSSVASHELLEMLPPGTVVQLERDVSATDRYGRLLAYVWVGPKLVNEAMVRDGWAVLYTVPPNVKYADRLGRAQEEARTRGTGLWAQRGFDCLPRDFRRGKCLNDPASSPPRRGAPAEGR